MSQNVQIGISKFHGIWTLALTDTVTLKSRKTAYFNIIPYFIGERAENDQFFLIFGVFSKTNQQNP